MAELLTTNEQTFAASSGTFRWTGGSISSGTYTGSGESVFLTVGSNSSGSFEIPVVVGREYTFAVDITTWDASFVFGELVVQWWRTNGTLISQQIAALPGGTGRVSTVRTAPTDAVRMSAIVTAFCDEFGFGTLAIDNASLDDGVAAPSGVSGTLAVTDDIDTLAASGSPVVTGSSAVTDDVDTLAASGSPVVTGSSAVTDDVDTLSASGAPVATGTLAVTDDIDVLAASGSPVATGSLAVTDDIDTLSSSGTLIVLGTLAVTDDIDTLTAAGTVTSDVVTNPTLNVPIVDDQGQVIVDENGYPIWASQIPVDGLIPLTARVLVAQHSTVVTVARSTALTTVAEHAALTTVARQVTTVTTPEAVTA